MEQFGEQNGLKEMMENYQTGDRLQNDSEDHRVAGMKSGCGE